MMHEQGHPPHNAALLIAVADTQLVFRDIPLADPVPTGRQIIEASGGRPADEYIVLQWLPNGELKELNLDDTIDIRASGIERFIVEKSATTYRFEVDGKRNEWPSPKITREALLAVADQDPAKFSVWQELRDQADKEILSGHPADLSPDGLERFYTVMTHTTEGVL